MAGTKEIKRRIKSVKNTKKITKAMELVAASKMKKAVAKTLASRAYAGYSWELLSSISERIKGDGHHPFFTENKKSDRYLFVVVTSNRGLCGGYNTQVLKRALLAFKQINDLSKIDIMIIGRKGAYNLRRAGVNIVASFTELPDVIELRDVAPISEMLATEFGKEAYHEVHMVYTDFISALSQKPRSRKLLPVSKEEFEKSIDSFGTETQKVEMPKNKLSSQYILEGDVSVLVKNLAEKLVRMQVYQMLLESMASEQSARMVSMKNAGDAATEMIDDLTLVFNKARQAGITKEISEISAGMASIS